MKRALVLACLLLAGFAVPAAAGTAVDEQVLFKASQDPGYACFRIPAIVKTARGTLLAFAEGRVDNCGDTGDIDLVLKRSEDGGRTWSPLQVIDPGDGDTHGNPVPVVDRETGRIVLISTYNAGRDDDKGCAIPCPRFPHQQHSDDDGKTWSVPRDIGAQVKRPEWTAWYASGPVHGIQLEKGPHAGRLVFGVNAETARGTQSVENHAALIYSDDHGDSWHIGAQADYPHSVPGTYPQKPQEISVAELADGSVYAAGREQGGTDVGNRTHAVSRDGGESFSTPFTTIPDLVTPIVQGSVLRLQRPGKPDRLLFSSPSDTDRRRWMMIRSSYDGGRTWENAEQGTRITSDWSGYSDLVQISDPRSPDAEIGLMYEGGPVDARDEIRFARFGEEHLGWKNPAGPSTPDLSRRHTDAIAVGSPSTVEGRFGRAVEPGGFLRVPYDEAQLPGDGDFTWTGWFRYGSSKADQVLTWLGGMGGTAPQLWLRAEPRLGRLVATMTTPAGTKSIATTSAYDDQQWHHAALRRTGDRLVLTVDGAEAAAGPASPGTINRTVSWQFVVGQRLDNTQRWQGAFDEIRFYRRALADAELDGIREHNATVPDGQVLRLPLDRISR